MDGLADIVHYAALVFIRWVMDFPALYPLNDVVAFLNWHNPDSKACDVEETRSFVKRLGMVIIETKNEDGLSPRQAQCTYRRMLRRPGKWRLGFSYTVLPNRAPFTIANLCGSAPSARR
jgi:hypothetical protein